MKYNPYRYPAEKFSTARRNLMLPHSRGEAESIAMAFHEMTLGLEDIEDEHLDDNARSWVRTIERLMDDEGIDDPAGEGTWKLKAEKLSVDEKLELSHAVDELAHWFDSRAEEES